MSDKREVRLIDANALCAILEAKADMALVPEYKHAFLNVQAMVNAMPTLDVKHVLHGLWAFSELGPLGCNVKCTECGWSEKDVDPALWLDYDGHKYCGCCGAKMDGEH